MCCVSTAVAAVFVVVVVVAVVLVLFGQETGQDLSVCVVEKGAEVGAHILSGNVFEPRALDELFPDWRDMGGPDAGGPPVTTAVRACVGACARFIRSYMLRLVHPWLVHPCAFVLVVVGVVAGVFV